MENIGFYCNQYVNTADEVASIYLVYVGNRSGRSSLCQGEQLHGKLGKVVTPRTSQKPIPQLFNGA